MRRIARASVVFLVVVWSAAVCAQPQPTATGEEQREPAADAVNRTGCHPPPNTARGAHGRLTRPSRIRRQAATGSWTRSRQWETQRTLFSSARATGSPAAKVNGVWPSSDAWLRAAL
jgi:hypothetical protein